MGNLEYIHLEFIKLVEFELSVSFCLTKRNGTGECSSDEQQNKCEVLCDNTNENRQYNVNDNNGNSNERYNHPMNKNIKQSHFGEHLVIELDPMISKCKTLIRLESKCYFSADSNVYNIFIQSIINHFNLQQNNIIFKELSDVFKLKKYSYTLFRCIKKRDIYNL